MNVTVKNVTLNSLAFKIIYEVFIIFNVTNNSLNVSYAFLFFIHVFFISSKVKIENLNITEN